MLMQNCNRLEKSYRKLILQLLSFLLLEKAIYTLTRFLPVKGKESCLTDTNSAAAMFCCFKKHKKRGYLTICILKVFINIAAFVFREANM